jgi:hypothetical protein
MVAFYSLKLLKASFFKPSECKDSILLIGATLQLGMLHIADITDRIVLCFKSL